jgi:hypothetical protein
LPQSAPTRPPSFNAHLLLSIYEDETDSKLPPIAGMDTSIGREMSVGIFPSLNTLHRECQNGLSVLSKVVDL